MTDDDVDRPEDRDMLVALERLLPPVSPRADLFDRVLEDVRGEATVVPLRPRARRLRSWTAGAVGVAVAAAAAIAIGVSVSGDGLGTPDATAAIVGKSVPGVRGEARLYGAGADGGHVLVTLQNVPPAPSGHHYEVWVLREGTTEMESVAVFTPASDTIELDVTLPGPGRYVAVDISVEADGGPPEHAPTSLATGTFA
jgi:anti-sigma-K factor RskA